VPLPNNNRRAEAFVIPPIDFELVSATTVGSDTALNPLCRGLLVGKAGFLNVTMQNGNQRNGVPFIEGTTPGFFAEVRTSTATGAARNVWAII